MMIVAVLIIFITYCSLILKRAFKWASRRANLTIQPTTVLDRLTVGRYLVLKVGVMDRGERGDQDALHRLEFHTVGGREDMHNTLF